MTDRNLVGRWFRDLIYEKNNNPIPLWAKDPWDCRILICGVKTVDHPNYGQCLTLKVMHGFQVRRHLVEGNKFVTSNVKESKFGYIVGVTIKDKDVWAYGNAKHRGILLDDKPDIIVFTGQEVMF